MTGRVPAHTHAHTHTLFERKNYENPVYLRKVEATRTVGLPNPKKMSSGRAPAFREV